VKVVYLTNQYMYINEDDRIVKSDIKKEKGIITSTIGYNDIINITFKLSKNIQKDMLEVEAEKYIFLEGSIDYSREYKINYVFKEFEDFYNVEAFIIETDVLKQKFENYLKTFKYIDFISAKPFVFKSYYDITKTTPKNDIFIYFDENETFLSCFEKGEFVFVKSINKLSALAKDLNLTIEETIEILKDKGLNQEKYEDINQYNIVDSFFSQFFMKVNNLINYSVSYYSLEKINRIYFYSPFNIKNIFENYRSFWELSGIEFKKYELETDYDNFDYTTVIYNSKNYENEQENFSIFPKPVAFYKTKGGVLFVFTLFLFLLIGIDGFMKYQTINENEQKIVSLKKHINRIKTRFNLLKNAINKYKKEYSTLQQENLNLKNQISDVDSKIVYLQNIQRKPTLTNQIMDITYEFKKYNLKLISMDKNATHTDLTVVSSFENSSNIAKFIKDMYNLGYKNITSKQIDNNNGIYIAKVSYDE